MIGEDRFAPLLRWYPAAWRARYGDEMAALLEDTHGGHAVPWRERLALARAGSVERARSAGLVGDAAGPDDRLRAGSLLILCAWALYLVAGSVFAKFTDQWVGTTPPSERWLPSDGITAVQWAAGVGAALVVAAALVVGPAFIRLVRHESWGSVRRPILRAVLAGAVAAALTVGILVWSHQLSPHDRNGGLVAYGVLFVVWGVAMAAALATSTAAAVSVARRLTLTRSALRVLGSMAVALVVTMAVVIAGCIAWWGAEATHAPGVLRNGIGNGFPFTSSSVPPTLVLAGMLMLVGLALAVFGTIRVVPALRSRPSA
jgi:hypothetical protein